MILLRLDHAVRAALLRAVGLPQLARHIEHGREEGRAEDHRADRRDGPEARIDDVGLEEYDGIRLGGALHHRAIRVGVLLLHHRIIVVVLDLRYRVQLHEHAKLHGDVLDTDFDALK